MKVSSRNIALVLYGALIAVVDALTIRKLLTQHLQIHILLWNVFALLAVSWLGLRFLRERLNR